MDGYPIKMDDLGVPLYSETPIWIYKTYKTLFNETIAACSCPFLGMRSAEGIWDSLFDGPAKTDGPQILESKLFWISKY